jgi:hypothetical protein
MLYSRKAFFLYGRQQLAILNERTRGVMKVS